MTTWTATIRGRVPSKKNSRVNTSSGRSFPSATHQAWEKDAGYQIAPHRPSCALSGPFTLMLHIERPNRQHWADPDNQQTAILDLLQKAGVIANDKDMAEWHGKVIDGTRHLTTITIQTEDPTR